MSELNLLQAPESTIGEQILKALTRLKRGEVLTAFLSRNADLDSLVSGTIRASGTWDFQKHRLGDGSWLLHAKRSR